MNCILFNNFRCIKQSVKMNISISKDQRNIWSPKSKLQVQFKIKWENRCMRSTDCNMFFYVRSWILGWCQDSDCKKGFVWRACNLDWNVYMSWGLCGPVLWVLCSWIPTYACQWGTFCLMHSLWLQQPCWHLWFWNWWVIISLWVLMHSK